MTAEEWQKTLAERHGEKRQKAFASGRVAVCGLGGLGSRIAEMLVRAGVGYLRLFDFDIVEAVNLNRQLYFAAQVGKYKTDALVENLRLISTFTGLDIHRTTLTEENIPQLLAGVDVVVEAFDGAEAKAMLVSGVREHFPDVPLVAASGMAGFGSGNAMYIRRISSRFYLCGDGVTDSADAGLYGARVSLCASEQALVTLQFLCGEEGNIVGRSNQDEE